MSYEDSDIYEVPWCSDRWDLAIIRRPDISFLGGPGRWVLYRPNRVVVTARALADRRVQDLVGRRGADRCDEPAAEVARALDLELLLAPEEQVVALVREINELDGCAASLDHVQLPGSPQHVHGDDDPNPAGNPGDIPGTGDAGANVKVLVLDTGCSSTATSILTHITGLEEEVIDEDGDGLRDPAAGHGTHVSGIVARRAPGATIVPRRLLTSPVGECSDLDVAQALIDHQNANVINCSFGAATLDNQAPLVIQQALAQLPATTVVVAAAGNAGLARFDWPAAFDRVLAVGAVGQPSGSTVWQQTSFSNFGPWVDCCAPGVDIVSTFPKVAAEGFGAGFASWTGTSMASPMVAGTIAAMAVKNGQGGGTPAQVAAAVAQAAVTIRGLQPIGAIGAFVDPAAPIV